MIKKRLIIMILVASIFGGVLTSCNSNTPNEEHTEPVSDQITDTGTQGNLNEENNLGNSENQDTDNGNSNNNADTLPQPPAGDTMVTVACIGDSITEGVGVDESERAVSAYPARLAEALGEGYEVLNYGKSGATMCGTSAGHYQAKNWFTYSGKYDDLKNRAKDIDVAFIMLGTNDGNSSNAYISDMFTDEKVDDFKADYKANLVQMVNDLRAGNANVKIYLMNSPKCFRTGNTWEQTLSEILRPMQASLAEELNLTLYDMYKFSSETMKNRNFPDNLHPGKYGYYLMGQELAKVVAGIYGTQTNKGEPPMSKINYEETFDYIANGTVLSNQNITTVKLGNSNIKVKVLENSTLAVNDGMLALTRSATTTDAYFEVILDESVFNGKHTFETSIKVSENFDSRGAIFYMFGYTFVQYNVYGNIMNKSGKKLGDLSSTEFVKITVVVDCDTETYKTYINDIEVDSGSFTMKEAGVFRPLQIYANGSSTLYLDYIKAYTVTE